MPTPKNPDPGDIEVLSCGCRFWTTETDAGRTFCFEPCSGLCPTVSLVAEEMAKQNKPMTILDMR